MTNDEYKVMGLSSYGSPEYLDKFAKLLRPNGINYELDKRRRKVADAMPAVVHVDNTARIQSVHADTNPLYSRLIGEFAKATSLPVLINTSLNINEQPTVNAPLKALHTYFCISARCCTCSISAIIGCRRRA